MSDTSPARKPAGIPTGGQFAPAQHTEADIELGRDAAATNAERQRIADAAVKAATDTMWGWAEQDENGGPTFSHGASRARELEAGIRAAIAGDPAPGASTAQDADGIDPETGRPYPIPRTPRTLDDLADDLNTGGWVAGEHKAEVITTGGNCHSVCIPDPDGGELLVSDHNGPLPSGTEPLDGFVVCYYAEDAEPAVLYQTAWDDQYRHGSDIDRVRGIVKAHTDALKNGRVAILNIAQESDGLQYVTLDNDEISYANYAPDGTLVASSRGFADVEEAMAASHMRTTARPA